MHPHNPFGCRQLLHLPAAPGAAGAQQCPAAGTRQQGGRTPSSSASGAPTHQLPGDRAGHTGLQPGTGPHQRPSACQTVVEKSAGRGCVCVKQAQKETPARTESDGQDLRCSPSSLPEAAASAGCEISHPT